jgi:acyl-CoA synthetase (AMP-forming)/AMP-acid ligase II
MFDTDNLGSLYDPDMGGDRTALIDCRDWQAPAEYSHRDIDGLANGVARGLLARGLTAGDAVAIISANRAEFLFAYLGCLRAGIIAVPVNYQFSAEIIEFILSDANIRLIFCDGPHKDLVSTDVPLVNFDATGPAGFEALLNPGPYESFLPGPEDIAMVLYTSGSTGRPKGVPLSHHGHVWALKSRMAAWPFDHHRLLVAAPLYHMNALCVSLFSMAVSACMVLLPEFDSRRYLQAIDRFRCTWITSVPTMLAMALMETDLLQSLDLSSVSVVRMGSAPVSQKLWQQIVEQFPEASVMNGYGTTEAGPIVFGSSGGKPVPPTSVGRQMPGVDLKLIDDAGQEADQGVLWHRTPATMRGYLNLPEKTAEVLTEDGWYISGDVFRRDEVGCYHFVGRSDDMFVCGGENIYPSEAEAVLVSHPKVVQACVVPVPDEIKGHKPVAFVVREADAPIGEAELKKHALANAPAFQHPRLVIFKDELPLAGPGKVDRKVLTREACEIWQENAR